jgi:bleomycin hydrolase
LTDHEFYKPFLLLIPDNWDFEQYYNVPLTDLTETIDFALENGYSVAWAADVSDKGFNHKKGVALVPEKDWSKMTAGERDSVFIVPVMQKNITPELRQQDFEDYSTTDDHSMHIIGLAKDQEGNTWYKVKNSWGIENSKYNGYFYASVPYIKFKTLAIYLNKSAIPKSISKKLGL